jgi:hypothetical protein
VPIYYNLRFEKINYPVKDSSLISLSGWSSVDTGCLSNKTSSTSSNQISGTLNKEYRKQIIHSKG